MLSRSERTNGTHLGGNGGRPEITHPAPLECRRARPLPARDEECLFVLDIDVATTARPLRTAWTVTVTGLLVMLVGAVIAARYTPFWFDPSECSLHDRCVTPESTAMLQAMWWVVGIGSVVVVAGLALTWRALPQ